MTYAAEAAVAVADLKRAGAAVAFTRAGASTYDPATDTWTPAAATTIAGYAIRVRGNPDTYRARSLIESQAPTLLFAPTVYGNVPKEGDTCLWGGVQLTVRDVAPLEPDGTPIIARVVVSA